MEHSVKNEEFDIDLREIISLLVRRLWLIILAGIVIATATFLISSYFVTPMYQSTTSIYVMNRRDSSSAITYNDLQTGSQLTKDYMTLVTSRPVTEQVIEKLGLDLSHSELVNLISVVNPSNTRILEITVKYPDPFMAKQIVDEVRLASAVHISNVMNIDQVNVVEEGNLPVYPSEPNVLMNTALGGMLGIMLALLIIILIYLQDDTIKTPEDIEKYLNISVLGTIPLQKNTMADMASRRKIRKKHRL